MIMLPEMQPEEAPPNCGHAQHMPPAEMMRTPGHHHYQCPGCLYIHSFLIYKKDAEAQ